MSTVRNKIILIFLGMVVLPVLPISILVNNLVHHSYSVGVNPSVETALATSIRQSRELYQHRKEQLGSIARSMAEQFQSSASGTLALPDETAEWAFLGLRLYNQEARQIASRVRDSLALPPINQGHLRHSDQLPGQQLIVSSRDHNRFSAVQRISQGNEHRYLVLTAAMNDDFLRETDQTLEVHQMYQRLSLQQVSIPQNLLTAFLVLGFLVVAVATAIAIWISQRITEPIAALVTGTEELGKGNLDYRIERTSRDEIGDLVERFNSMAHDLKTFQEKTIYLEKMAAWQEIARRLAHEIKNPLTPIQLTVQEMVDQYNEDNADYQQLLTECHQIVNEEIEALRKLVNEFSAFGRLPELQLEAGNLNSLIADVSKLYPHLSIELKLDDNIPEVEFDDDRIRRVLINLIENAAQAGGDQAPIQLSSRLVEPFVEVSVRDKGKGMSDSVRQQVFQPYFSTKDEGVGLGLAISRKMIEEHDGTIRVDSVLGEGSIFTFQLPIKD